MLWESISGGQIGIDSLSECHFLVVSPANRNLLLFNHFFHIANLLSHLFKLVDLLLWKHRVLRFVLLELLGHFFDYFAFVLLLYLLRVALPLVLFLLLQHLESQSFLLPPLLFLPLNLQTFHLLLLYPSRLFVNATEHLQNRLLLLGQFALVQLFPLLLLKPHQLLRGLAIVFYSQLVLHLLRLLAAQLVSCLALPPPNF